MKKSISTAEMRKSLMVDIGTWLKEAEKVKAENGPYAFENGPYAFENELKNLAMAHALYLCGNGLGIVSAKDYPQFKREGETI